MTGTNRTVKGLVKGTEVRHNNIRVLPSRTKKSYIKSTVCGTEESNDHGELLKLILTLSTNFIILSPEDTDDGIVDVLKSIGRYANVDRSYVFQFSDDGKYISNTHEWCVKGILSQKKKLQNISSDSMPWFCGKIKNLEIIHIPDIDDIPLDAIEEKRSLSSQKIMSIIAVPIVTGYKAIGFLGFESIRKKTTWSENIISLLKIVGEIFANALLRKQMALSLQASESKYRNIFENATEGIFQIRNDGNILSVNTSFSDMYGYESPDVLIGKVSIDRHFFADKDEYNRLKHILEEKGSVKGYEILSRKKDGTLFWISLNARAVRNEKNQIIYLEGTVENINERKQIELMLKESEERYRILTEQSPVGIYLIQDGLFRYVNKTFAEIHGYDPEEIINKLSPRDLTIVEEGTSIEKIVRDLWDDKGGMRLEILARRKDGTVRNGEIYGSKVIYNGKPAVLGTMLDITEKKQMEERLKALSITDELTGLLNRRGFFTLAEQQLKMARRLGKELILFFIDMDGLKWINDNIGHQEGDKALITLAKALKDTFRESDIIGRLGGDEFAVFALSTGSTNPDLLVKRLNFSVDNYNTTEQLAHKISFSIGFVKYDPMNHNSLDDLILVADNIMYAEKKKKKGIEN
ncbi:MAG: PAS domain S-box protein [Syntrophorhabdaceae bacterium]|nr:PAS domain S-box protein [Syntrophorhabdaceae bacterium]